VLRNDLEMFVDQDALVLASSSMPDWCRQLTISCPLLFPFETRQLYFNATAFGASRYACDNNNNNNNKHDNVYGAVIMAEPLREFTRFI